jgi:hypothetical protein
MWKSNVGIIKFLSKFSIYDLIFELQLVVNAAMVPVEIVVLHVLAQGD